MNVYLIIFSNRTETLDFSNLLKKYGVDNSIIATPKGVASSCGISIRLYENSVNYAIRLLQSRAYLTFIGIYKGAANRRGGFDYSRISF